MNDVERVRLIDLNDAHVRPTQVFEHLRLSHCKKWKDMKACISRVSFVSCIHRTPVVQDYRKKWLKPSLTTPDRSCMVRIGPDFVRIDPDFVRIDPDHSGSILP